MPRPIRRVLFAIPTPMRAPLLLGALAAGTAAGALVAQSPAPRAAPRGEAARPRAGAASLRIEGDVPRPTTLTAEQVRALPHETVRAADHAQPAAEYAGVPLAAVLAQAGVSFATPLRGAQLARYVVVEAADGYRVTFAAAELDSSFTRKVVLLVDQADGRALPAGAGPFRLVVPDEKRHGRWVRQVTTVRLLGAPGARPAGSP